jgi:ADP-ribosylglycohydrolase
MRGADALLAGEADDDEVAAAVAAARAAAAAGPTDVTRVENLGGGWTGEEALAIALYAALAHDAAGGPEAVARTLWTAAAHGGDSDSTGSVAGNLVGALAGPDALPGTWLAELELHDVVTTVAAELAASTEGAPVDETRYPGEAGALVGVALVR